MGLSGAAIDRARAIEKGTLATLFAAAHAVGEAAIARSRHPPRFVLERARIMARHLGIPDRRLQELGKAMGLWQAYLPSALGSDATIFSEAAFRLPWSYETIRSGMASMSSLPQVVVVAFHMAAMPLTAALLASACTSTHSRSGHVFISPRNLGWLGLESSRWILDAGEIIIADLPGLRRLMSGLRDGTITRLLVLLDGPHPSGGRDTRALTTIAPTLAFRTGLMSTILDMGIPMRPITHCWELDSLIVEWHPYLNHPPQTDSNRTREEAISVVASLIEDLLRRHPEQWLNWAAAGLRT